MINSTRGEGGYKSTIVDVRNINVCFHSEDITHKQVFYL